MYLEWIYGSKHDFDGYKRNLKWILTKLRIKKIRIGSNTIRHGFEIGLLGLVCLVVI